MLQQQIEKPLRKATLGTGALLDDDKQYERNMELGNYGSVSYTALTRFIYEVLQYLQTLHYIYH